MYLEHQKHARSNPGKTEVLHFTSRFMKQPSFGDSITFAGTEIIITKKARNLGVIMDNNLSFSSHINEICKKSTLAIRSIGRIRKYLSLDGLKMLVNALVISRLDYCNCLLYSVKGINSNEPEYRGASCDGPKTVRLCKAYTKELALASS